MQPVHDRVFVGNGNSCQSGNEQLAVVHACKSPCHQAAIGYKGSLAKTHPNYLHFEGPHDLYLNIVDPPVPLFMLPTFSTFLKFAGGQWSDGKKLLIHCNQGESRAPSLALLFLAKGLATIDNSSYMAARKAFEKLYPSYAPGQGIETYFTNNWSSLGV